MSGDLTPNGFIRLYDAVDLLARIPQHSKEDDIWCDIGDRLKDAMMMAEATNRIREAGIDGRLRGYHFVGDGKAHVVPEDTWTEHSRCLVRAGPDLGFEDVWLFDRNGLEINGVRRPVFFVESELEAFLRGEATPKSALLPRSSKRGRRKGSTEAKKGDDALLDLMAPMILEQGISVMNAADIVVRENPNLVWRMTANTSDDSISSRLQRKWRDPQRRLND